MQIPPEELLEAMCPEFATLAREQGWRYLSGSYNSEVFGNTYVNLESDVFRIKIFKDRGEFFADIGNRASADSYDLAGLMDYLGIRNPNLINSPTAQRLRALAIAMREHMNQITVLFQDDNLKKSGFVSHESDRNKNELERLRKIALSVRLR